MLIVCVGRSVRTRYYLQIFTIYTALVLKLKIHTRVRIVPMWAIKLGHSLIASIWIDNCWIDYHDYATEMNS